MRFTYQGSNFINNESLYNKYIYYVIKYYPHECEVFNVLVKIMYLR